MKLWILLIAYLVADTEAYRGYYKRWKHRKPVCEPIECEKNCKEVPVSGECPKCECDIDIEIKEDDEVILDPRTKGFKIPEEKIDFPKVSCLPPKCPPGCVIEKDIDSPCPTCKCVKDEEILPVAIKKNIKCSPPKCPFGCVIETEFSGPCPGCKCGKDYDDDDAPEVSKPKILCSPPKCGPDCEIEKIFDGPCPGCKCEKKDVIGPFKPRIPCYPPRCPKGCEIEKVFDGPCPGCKCEIDDIPDIPIKKGGGDPVKCPPGCKEDRVGPFPRCVCMEDIDEISLEKFDDKKKDCEVLFEDCSKPGCDLKMDEKGCEMCECKPICDPPKCPRRCKIDNTGECPKCVCKKIRWGWKSHA